MNDCDMGAIAKERTHYFALCTVNCTRQKQVMDRHVWIRISLLNTVPKVLVENREHKCTKLVSIATRKKVARIRAIGKDIVHGWAMFANKMASFKVALPTRQKR